eukprot:31481-Pelagococcus_subviridis.AAC.13
MGTSVTRTHLHRHPRELVHAEERVAAVVRALRGEHAAARALADGELLLVHDAVVALRVRVRARDLRDEADGSRRLLVALALAPRAVRLSARVADVARVILQVRPYRALAPRRVRRRRDEREADVGVALAVVAVRHEQRAVRGGVLADEERAARADARRRRRREEEEEEEEEGEDSERGRVGDEGGRRGHAILDASRHGERRVGF